MPSRLRLRLAEVKPGSAGGRAAARSARRSSLENRAILKAMSVEHAFTPIELGLEPQSAMAAD
jgi:hypothetical protein